MTAGVSRAAIRRAVVMSAGMAAAIQEGRKTTFREVVLPQPDTPGPAMLPVSGEPYTWISGKSKWRPGYLPGDRLYVQEPWNKHGGLATYLADGDWIAEYLEAAVPPLHRKPQWEDADGMPEEYARLELEVVSVQAKRLQAITPEQAAAEGMVYDKAKGKYFITEGDEYKGRGTSCAREAFYMLWESMRTGYMWTANPWVWVVEFRLVD